MDVDHFIDYVRCVGWNFNLKRFFDFMYGVRYERLTIFFHAYEYSILILFMLIVSGSNPLVIAVGVGFMQHLLLDQIFNPVKPMAYFITYRLRHGFTKECILKDDFLSSLYHN